MLALAAAAYAVVATGTTGADFVASPRVAPACPHVSLSAPMRILLAHQTGTAGQANPCRRTVLPQARLRSAYAVAARVGIAELAGAGGDHIRAAWNPRRGLWYANNGRAHWWQSALALRTLVRYLERTGNTNPIYQRVILDTYRRNVLTPQALARTNFVNRFLDDTAWWGLAWLSAARYELRYRHDFADASTFLRVAEWDATDVADAPKSCGGVAWELGYPPDTIANAEFATLAAELYSFLSKPGTFQDPALAAQWLAQARYTVRWLVRTKLVDVKTGTVVDTMDGQCTPMGGPITYTEGEVAEAFTELGVALHDRSYFKVANRFLRYVTGPGSEMITGGILHERCEALPGACGSEPRRVNLPAYKGIFVQAVADWSAATGSKAYRRFLLAQATSILSHDISDGAGAGYCQTPHACEFGFRWAGPIPTRAARIGVTAGTQTSALDALTSVLPRTHQHPRATPVTGVRIAAPPSVGRGETSATGAARHSRPPRAAVSAVG